MNDMLQRQRWFGTRHLHFLSAVGMSVLFALAVCGTGLGQEPAAQIEVSGKVTTPEGHPISGVTVRVRGGSTNTTTDAQGNYSILAPSDGVLTFNLIGFRGTGLGIAGRTTMNVAMDRAMAVLPEVVVTGYTSQRRSDITGAVGTVDVDNLQKQTTTSVLQRLDGSVSGVTVDASGSPGSRSTVRIRGITSCQNNHPLYIIDGPAIPAFIFPNNGHTQTTDTLNLSSYAWPGPANGGSTLIMPGSAGTNWWKAVFSPAQVTDANLRVAGGGADNAYNASFNFLNQEGTAAFNRLQRGTLRVNTAFNVDKFVVGGNVALSREQSFGGISNDDFGEDNILGKNILMQPIVPVYDIGGHFGHLLDTDPSSRYIKDALADPDTKNDSSAGNNSRLLSFFGKADYNYDGKYFLSLTVRRDGSSTFSPGHQWGTFPAFNVGWRFSQEPFLAGKFLTNAMLRFGWGVTGNQNVPLRLLSTFGGNVGDVFYDIGNTGTTVVKGYRLTSIGNPDLKWEENKSANVGVDLAAFDGRGTLSLDVYQRQTDNLLFPAAIPATEGRGNSPIVNIGSMRNRGIDFSIGYRGTLGEQTSYSVNFNGSHYKNTILRLDNAGTLSFFGPNPTRLTNHVINQVGSPIGSSYGYQADRHFNSTAEITALDAAAQAAAGGDGSVRYQAGEAPGRLKFRDTNGDGRITPADFTIIGSPHPDFTAGLDFSLRRGAWDLSFTVFGTFGNQIFDDQKDFYIFRDFSTNVRNDLLTNSWCQSGDEGCTHPADPNAKYPRIDRKSVV